MEWPDACLGAGGPAESCALVVTPGYKLTFEADDGTYVYHTDPSGYQFRLVTAPEPALGETIIAWTGQAEDGSCREAVFGADGLAFGRCGGKLLGTSYVKQTRQAELVDFAARYASFDVPTPTGTIVFTADGPTAATPAEQRMLAEWAWLVQWEAQNGGPITWSEALAWHREGGVAGFCDDLAIDVTGEATARSCAGGQQVKLGRTHLDAAQLADLYRWIDTLQPFQTETVDPATADAMTVRLAFNGVGPGQATDADIRAISDFAARVYEQIEAETQAGTTPDRLSREHRGAAGAGRHGARLLPDVPGRVQGREAESGQHPAGDRRAAGRQQPPRRDPGRGCGRRRAGSGRLPDGG